MIILKINSKIWALFILLWVWSSSGQLLSLDQEVFIKIRDLTLRILGQFPPDKYHYVGIGRSPTPIMALMEELGIEISQIPLTKFQYPTDSESRWNYPSGEPLGPYQLNELFEHFDKFLISPSLVGDKKLLIIDFQNQGWTLISAAEHINLYLKNRGRSTQVELLGLTGYDRGISFDSNLPYNYIPLTDYPKLQYKVHMEEFEKVSKYPQWDIRFDYIDDANTVRPEYTEFRATLRGFWSAGERDSIRTELGLNNVPKPTPSTHLTGSQDPCNTLRETVSQPTTVS